MSQVLDANRNQIMKGSIVSMADPHGPWSSYQGLVMTPYSDIEGEGYTVPVFFNREVSASYFDYGVVNGRMGVREWDAQYLAQCAKGETDLLFVDDAWKNCPRVRYFKPEELVVIPSWDTVILCNRTFKNRWNFCEGLPFKDKFQPGEYQCWIEGCLQPSLAQAALYNCWGTVTTLCLCQEHHKGFHGISGDGLSSTELKKTLFLSDGRRLSTEGDILT